MLYITFQDLSYHWKLVAFDPLHYLNQPCLSVNHF